MAQVGVAGAARPGRFAEFTRWLAGIRAEGGVGEGAIEVLGVVVEEEVL